MRVGEQEIRESLGDWSHRGGPVYVALADGLAELVARGSLPVGARLPAERRLADTLNVSRGTVVSAYDRLRELGLARTRHGSGTIVDDGRSRLASPREAHLSASLARNSIFSGFLADPPEDLVDLRGAYWVGTEDLPRAAFTLPAGELDALLADHGYHPPGYAPLRTAIAAYLGDRGLPTVAEQVLVTAGAQQALALAAQMFVTPGDTVLFEELTFPGALDAFTAADARIRSVPLTSRGVDPAAFADRLARLRPRLAYIEPVHNPTGAVLPALARRRIAEAAAGWDGVLLEDLTLADTQRAGTPPPPIAAYWAPEAIATVLTIGSLSKLMWGGLRIGWIRGPQPLIARLARLKALADLGSPLVEQAVAARLLADVETIRARRVAGLAERLDVLTSALRELLPEWAFTVPDAGLCLWVRLPAGSSEGLAAVALRHGVAVAPGGVSAPDGGWGQYLRLPFGQRPEVLREGVRRLAGAWEEYRGVAVDPARMGVVV